MPHRRTVSSSGRDEAGIQRFVERFGALYEASGMPRMASRVLALGLADDDGRMTADEICEALQASRAAVSTATQYLIQISLMRKEREPGSRRDIYVVSDDTLASTLLDKGAVIEHTIAMLREGLAACGGKDTPGGHRLWLALEFYLFLGEQMTAMATHWQAHRDALIAAHPRP